MRQAKQIGPLREKAVQAPAGVLEACLLARDAERHVARLRLYSEFREEANQVRIGTIVVNDEPGIHRNRSSRFGILD